MKTLLRVKFVALPLKLFWKVRRELALASRQRFVPHGMDLPDELPHEPIGDIYRLIDIFFPEAFT